MLPDEYVTPDVGVILTTSDEVRLARQGNRGKAVETFEAKADDFQERVNHAYPKIAKEFNISVVDASGTIDEVQAKILQLVENA